HRGADLGVGRLAARARALGLGAAGTPGGVLAEAQRKRRRPGGHRERHNIALLDREGGFEGELDRLAEVGLELDERTLRDQLPGEVRFGLRTEDRDAGFGDSSLV